MVPAASTPSAIGGVRPTSHWPVRTNSSQLPTPAARISIRTSSFARGRGSGRSIGPTAPPNSLTPAARIKAARLRDPPTSPAEYLTPHRWGRSSRVRKIRGLSTKAKSTLESDPLAPFSAPVRRWFEASFEGPTPAQAGGWEAISSGEHTLICAPTGSGKTLASFLWGIDKLARAKDLGTGVKLVYVSPLKALSYDIERNLRAPLRGIGAEIAVGLRTGDTSQKERRAMAKTPPDILITTPESLYLMLSSSVREILTGVEAVIVDEIHAVAQTKRGSHLALTLERLDHLVEFGVGSGEGSPDKQRGVSGDPSPDPPSTDGAGQ